MAKAPAMDPLLSHEPRRRRNCCNAGCCKRATLIAIPALLVLAACVAITFYITHKVDKAHYAHDKPPPNTCGNGTLQLNTWYYGEKDWSFVGQHSVFHYAVNFESTQTLARPPGHNPVTFGNVQICSQVTDSHASGPFNCKNSFVYDPDTCSTALLVSDCSEQVAHQYTDMHIQWLGFYSNQSAVGIEFSSNTPNAGGIMFLKPMPSPIPIVCPQAQ
eukprot:c21410_g1_i1.p1 GENE.c21410_g1_i1~~c21410_g1_i1.p1  ORF type:complete len:228 (+),score=34.65 c21410_g1_i1:36-686(+)